MMAMLGQWLGFDTVDHNHNQNQHQPQQPQHTNSSSPRSSKQVALTIKPSAPSNPSCNKQPPTPPPQPLRKTKSDELLRDFELMRFFCHIDQRLKEHGQLLTQQHLTRLQTLHAQATLDQCSVLTDIVEHFEEEHEKLRHRLAVASPNSAANDAMRGRWMTVF